MLAVAWKSLGWFLAGVAVALGFLLVPLQVAAERKKLDRTTAQIDQAERDIRALETEFDTRANLAQLDRWNSDTLRLVAPSAAQFVPDEAALASIDARQAVPGGEAQMASFVPSAPEAEVAPAAPASPPVVAAVEPIRASPIRASPIHANPVSPNPVRPNPIRPNIVEHAHQTVAMLDRKLLSDRTVGDLLSGARSEARGSR